MSKLPLNGTKTHPLTPFALGELRSIARKPCPYQAINAGVADRLLREDLVEVFQHTSPYATHKGAPIRFLRATDAGRTRAAQL